MNGPITVWIAGPATSNDNSTIPRTLPGKLGKKDFSRYIENINCSLSEFLIIFEQKHYSNNSKSIATSKLGTTTHSNSKI